MDIKRGKAYAESLFQRLSWISQPAGFTRGVQASTQDRFYPYSSSSSRLLTGNFSVYTKLEKQIARSFDREAALIFNSGYHANTGILPALTDKQTLLLADKLVHASIIDGILLSGSPFLRYRHNDYDQLERLVQKNACQYETIIILTESIFSMDGDVADLNRLIAIKRQYPNILLYVDEAHAIGARGKTGLGIAEEQGCIQEIDLLVGTFGKALASMGAYLVCSRTIREYLVNTMRPLIFSTALPPFQIAWTSFIWEQLPSFTKERENLLAYSRLLAEALTGKGGEISQSHIILSSWERARIAYGKRKSYNEKASTVSRFARRQCPKVPPVSASPLRQTSR